MEWLEDRAVVEGRAYGVGSTVAVGIKKGFLLKENEIGKCTILA